MLVISPKCSNILNGEILRMLLRRQKFLARVLEIEQRITLLRSANRSLDENETYSSSEITSFHDTHATL